MLRPLIIYMDIHGLWLRLMHYSEATFTGKVYTINTIVVHVIKSFGNLAKRHGCMCTAKCYRVITSLAHRIVTLKHSRHDIKLGSTVLLSDVQVCFIHMAVSAVYATH
jgi:hypothetical protein